jgi:hypothetical protein
VGSHKKGFLMLEFCNPAVKRRKISTTFVNNEDNYNWYNIRTVFTMQVSQNEKSK